MAVIVFAENNGCRMVSTRFSSRFLQLKSWQKFIGCACNAQGACTKKNSFFIIRLLEISSCLIKKGCDISNSEKVKEFIANRETWNNSTKLLTVATYKTFADFAGMPFRPPRYPPQEKIPFIQIEKELDDLIAGCGKKKATLLQLLKETGMRIGEAENLKWTDIDLENQRITLNNPEKKGRPRIFKITPKLTAMLNALPKEKDGPFRSCYSNIYKDFQSPRRSARAKFQNQDFSA